MNKFPKSIVLSVLGALFTFTVIAGSALAQEGPFSNASLNGTYLFTINTSAADAPVWNNVVAGMTYWDGEGNGHLLFLVINLPGEPDAEGNPTRNLIRNISDESTWAHQTRTYEVLPFGAFTTSNPANGSVSDGIPIETAMIDGVLTITKYRLINRGVGGTGGVLVWEMFRIADGDILPPAPDEE